jgi:hypothetical protein
LKISSQGVKDQEMYETANAYEKDNQSLKANNGDEKKSIEERV